MVEDWLMPAHGFQALHLLKFADQVTAKAGLEEVVCFPSPGWCDRS